MGIKPLALLASTAMLAACAGMPSTDTDQTAAQRAEAASLAALNGAPEWSVNPPHRSGMAYGVGSIEVIGDAASAVRRAGELARIDLVSQLRVTISGDFSSITTETNASGQATSVQRRVQQKVRSQVAEVTLDEVIIKEASVANGTAYALAELDRNAAAARLRQQITEVEQQLDQYAQVQPEGDTLQQLRVMLPVLNLLAERQAYADKLALVAMDNKAAPLLANHRQLQQRVLDLLDTLVVKVNFSNATARSMSGELLQALTSQGLKVQQAGSYDLLFDVSAERSNRTQDNRYYAFVKARVQIQDADQRVLSSFSDTARGISGLETVAWQKASEAVAEKLQTELANTLAERLM